MLKRKFEKISEETWLKDTTLDERLLNEVTLPMRGTKNSAGYDFYSPVDIIIKANDSIKIPTGIKVSMYEDEVLQIYVRSSLGFKYNIRLNNSTGIIDSDYYNNNDNEGHIWIKLYNPNNYDIEIKKGDRFAQGIFMKYLIAEDDNSNNVRNGGIGSTNKEKI